MKKDFLQLNHSSHLLQNYVLLNTQIGQMTLIVISARMIQLGKVLFHANIAITALQISML